MLCCFEYGLFECGGLVLDFLLVSRFLAFLCLVFVSLVVAFVILVFGFVPWLCCLGALLLCLCFCACAVGILVDCLLVR